MNTTLHLRPVNGGPFNCRPAAIVELPPERILTNDVRLPHDRTNIHKVRLFVIGHEFGPIGAVWAGCEQDAFDELVDAGLGDALLVSEEDQERADDKERDEWAHLGNAGEPADLTHAWIQEVEFVPERDWQLIARFAEARGSGVETLNDV